MKNETNLDFFVREAIIVGGSALGLLLQLFWRFRLLLFFIMLIKILLMVIEIHMGGRGFLMEIRGSEGKSSDKKI